MVERHQVEDLQIARRRDERAIEVVGDPVEIVHFREETADAADQVGLQGLPLAFEQGDRLVRPHRLVRERQVGLDQPAHLVAKADDVGIGDVLPAELTVHAARQGMVDLEHLPR